MQIRSQKQYNKLLQKLFHKHVKYQKELYIPPRKENKPLMNLEYYNIYTEQNIKK